MKQICLLTTKYTADTESPWLTNELASALNQDGFKVTVVALSWLEGDPPSSTQVVNGINVIRIKLAKFFYKKNLFFTAIKLLSFPIYTMWIVRKYIKACDALITNTPCITMLGSAPFFKFYFKAKSFLILWDFFPYYLKDLGTIRGSLYFNTLLFAESSMYKTFDAIGCMTQKNTEFLMQKYNYSSPSKIHRLPIWTNIHPMHKSSSPIARDYFNLPRGKVIAVYGGAISVVQELDNLLNLASAAKDISVHFLIVGGGNDYERIYSKTLEMGLENLTFIPAVNRVKYNELISICDIGLIFLSHKLTVPSFPSKSLDYFRASLPILAGIDEFTDFGAILEHEIGAGFAESANETGKLLHHLIKLAANPDLRNKLGSNGRKYYEERLDVHAAKNTILKALTIANT